MKFKKFINVGLIALVATLAQSSLASTNTSATDSCKILVTVDNSQKEIDIGSIRGLKIDNDLSYTLNITTIDAKNNIDIHAQIVYVDNKAATQALFDINSKINKCFAANKTKMKYK